MNHTPNDGHNMEHIGNDDNTHEIPRNADRSRPPQRNLALSRCRCGCQCCQGAGGDEQRGSDSDGAHRPTILSERGIDRDAVIEDHVSEGGTCSLSGDEGVEDHQIAEHRNQGIAALQAFALAAMREHNSWHTGILPDRYFGDGCDSPGRPGTPSSMQVHAGSSGEHSMDSSCVLGTRSGSPAPYLPAMGAGCGEDTAYRPVVMSYFIDAPIPLSPDYTFARNMEYAIHYPLELNMSDSEFGEFDMW